MSKNKPDYLTIKCQSAAELLLNEGRSLDDDHLLALAQILAVDFYKMQGYRVGHDFDFLNSAHPMEQRMFAFGLHAVGLMRNTEIESLAEEYRHEQV